MGESVVPVLLHKDFVFTLFACVPVNPYELFLLM